MFLFSAFICICGMANQKALCGQQPPQVIPGAGHTAQTAGKDTPIKEDDALPLAPVLRKLKLKLNTHIFFSLSYSVSAAELPTDSG